MTVLIVIILILIAIVIFLYFRPSKPRAVYHVPYIEGLIAKLENNDELAIRKLREAVGLDTNLIDAYVRLGNLYRKKGDIDRAIQIHQSLTVRPTLRRDEEKRIYFALVEDYLVAQRFNKAVSYLKEILKIDRNDTRARQLIANVYEDLGNYQDCLAFFEDIGRSGDDRRRAFYTAQMGLSRIKEQSPDKEAAEKEGLGLLKKALKIDAQSLTALYHLAEHYRERGELKKAKEYYEKIIAVRPTHAFLVIPNLEKIMYELNSFDEIIPIYEKLFNDNPRNAVVGYALASLYEKKNDVESSRAIYRKLADISPKSMRPRLRMLNLMVQDKQAAREIQDLERLTISHLYTCTQCGYSTEKYLFLCPQCHALESLLPSS